MPNSDDDSVAFHNLMSVRAGLARYAVALMAITVRAAFPDATTFTVEITNRSACLVAVKDRDAVLWLTDFHANRNGMRAKVDDVLRFALVHGGLDPATRPNWTASRFGNGLWNVEITDTTVHLLGNGLSWPVEA